MSAGTWSTSISTMARRAFTCATARARSTISTPLWRTGRFKLQSIVPTDISFRNEVGVSVPLTDIPAAGKAVADMLDHPGRFAAKIENLLKTQFFNPGHAGEVAGKYILESLINRKKGTKK